MDKQRYLQTALQQIDALTQDTSFRNQLFQVRARAILDEFGSERETPIRFTFEPERIWRYCDFVFSESIVLLNEGYGQREELLSGLKEIAEAFEFLAKFANRDDEEILLINAALCYHLAGYQANALCLSRQVQNEYLRNETTPEEIDQLFAFLYRKSLIDFLKRDITELSQQAIASVRRIHDLQEEVTRRVSEELGTISDLMDITAHAYFHNALSSFVQFCLNGKEEEIVLSERHVFKSSEYFRKSGDVRLGTITFELLPLIEVFRQRSTWETIRKAAPQQIENPIWRAYLRNLALEKSIVEFWPAQLNAIESGLLSDHSSYVLQMPTSAGKTFVAELGILSALTTTDGAQCLYIAPYRALVNEIEAKLSDTLGAVGYRVSTLIGGFEFDSFQEFLLTNSDVLVATPEKTELLLRTHREFFENLALVVIDEGHIIDEGIPAGITVGKTLVQELEENGTLGRGSLLEMLITRLKSSFPNVRFLFLSAVMPEINAHDFVAWLSESGKSPLQLSPDQRPSRQVLAKFEWIPTQDKKGNGELEYTSLEPLPNGRHPFVPYFITRKQYLTGETTPKTGKPKKKTWPESLDNKAQTTAMLAAKFARSGPTLVFCAQREDTKNVVANLITTLKYLEASGPTFHATLKYEPSPDLESYHLSLEWLGEQHVLTEALQHGVGLHIGPLPDPLRQAIEDEYKQGKIRILVSTNTLGQGVNLPIKTAIIYSLERVWGEKDEDGRFIRHAELVKKRDFWNICGRAGRAGKETEGQVIFVKISSNDQSIFTQYQDMMELEEVDSALYQLLLALIENRISQEELIGYLDSYILALLAEEIVNTEDEAALETFLNDSLIGVQALRKRTSISPFVSAMRNVSTWIVSRVPERERILAFASTGLRLSSCESLEEAVDNFLGRSEAQGILQNTETEFLRCNPILIRSAFDACVNLAEMQLDRQIKYRPEMPRELFEAWVQGMPVSQLRSEFWDQDYLEDFGRYVSDQLTYKLPWGINGFLRILAGKLQQEFNELPRAWQHLPAMAKFGVDNVVACWASSIGVTSRAFAMEISEVYIERHGVIDFQEFASWAVNLPSEFVLREMQGTKYEKKRFFDARNDLVVNRDLLNHIRNESKEIIVAIRGIQYENRREIALLVNQGDSLELELEIDNLYDPYAVKVLFDGRQIGYVERDKARIVSRELQSGRSVSAYAEDVQHPRDPLQYGFSAIRMVVQIA